MKKLIILIMLLVMMPILSSCSIDFDEISADVKNGTIFLSREEKFEKAIERLSEVGCTMECAMRMDLTLTASGKTQKQTTITDMLMERSSTEAYIESVTNGTVDRVYQKIVDDKIHTYEGGTGYWTHQVQDLADYEEENFNIYLDIEVKDAFVYEDGVWVGNVELLSEDLKQYADELAGEIITSGVKLEVFTMDKYNVKMDKGEISEMEITFTISMSYYSQRLDMQVSMPIKVTNVGVTEVTVPEGVKTIN